MEVEEKNYLGKQHTEGKIRKIEVIGWMIEVNAGTEGKSSEEISSSCHVVWITKGEVVTEQRIVLASVGKYSPPKL